MTKEKKPDGERIDHLHITDEDFDQISKTKRHKDEISQQLVTTETITVGRRDIGRLKETEKPRYPKDLDVGRIVIEEIPEEKEKVPKREAPKKEQIRPKSIEVTARQYEIEERAKTYPEQREVGRLVIEELPEKIDKRPQKYPMRPKSTEVTVTREQVSDASRPYEKEDIIKVGRLDIRELEKTEVEPRRIQERPLREEEKVEHLQKVRYDFFKNKRS